MGAFTSSSRPACRGHLIQTKQSHVYITFVVACWEGLLGVSSDLQHYTDRVHVIVARPPRVMKRPFLKYRISNKMIQLAGRLVCRVVRYRRLFSYSYRVY